MQATFLIWAFNMTLARCLGRVTFLIWAFNMTLPKHLASSHIADGRSWPRRVGEPGPSELALLDAHLVISARVFGTTVLLVEVNRLVIGVSGTLGLVRLW